MATFAVLDSNFIVTNTIVCENKELAEYLTSSLCQEYSDSNPAVIGYTYDSENNVFIPPQNNV